MEARDGLQDLGRGIAQIHMRVGRLIELVEQRETGPAPRAAPADSGRSRDALLDLLDALDAALARRAIVEPAATTPAVQGSFLRRLLGAPAAPVAAPAADEDLWRGLALASARAHEALAAEGFAPIPESGPYDATCQRVVESIPARPGEAIDVVVRTHRRGWARLRNGAREVVRVAHVSVRTEAPTGTR